MVSLAAMSAFLGLHPCCVQLGQQARTVLMAHTIPTPPPRPVLAELLKGASTHISSAVCRWHSRPGRC